MDIMLGGASEYGGEVQGLLDWNAYNLRLFSDWDLDHDSWGFWILRARGKGIPKGETPGFGGQGGGLPRTIQNERGSGQHWREGRVRRGFGDGMMIGSWKVGGHIRSLFGNQNPYQVAVRASGGDRNHASGSKSDHGLGSFAGQFISNSLAGALGVAKNGSTTTKWSPRKSRQAGLAASGLCTSRDGKSTFSAYMERKPLQRPQYSGSTI